MAEGFEIRSRHRSFGGRVTFCSHRSVVNSCEMRFSVFEPPEAAHRPVPVVTWLSGLSCTEENFMVKAGAQRLAAELGLMIVVPDPKHLEGMPAKRSNGGPRVMFAGTPYAHIMVPIEDLLARWR